MKICYRIGAGVLIVASLLLVGCGSSQVRGDGKSVTKTRQLKNVNEIQINGAYNVEVIQGSSDSLKVTTDSNIEPLVITEAKGNQLAIRNKTGVRFSLKQPILIQVVVKNLKSLSASGDNQVVLSNLNGNSLNVETSGSVQANLSGKVGKLSMQSSGSSNINAGNLIAQKVVVRLMGSGQVTVNATDKLDSKITGDGSIMYSGNPHNVSQSIVGSGKLERIK